MACESRASARRASFESGVKGLIFGGGESRFEFRLEKSSDLARLEDRDHVTGRKIINTKTQSPKCVKLTSGGRRSFEDPQDEVISFGNIWET